jgi:hypothetical protein
MMLITAIAKSLAAGCPTIGDPLPAHPLYSNGAQSLGGELMSRPRLSSRLQCWVPDRVAEAFEQLATDGMLTPSDHIRRALVNYLAQLGINTAPRSAQSNGTQHQPANVAEH